MENTANKKIQTSFLTGYSLEVQNNLGKSISILIQEKHSGKIFTADLTHEQLNEAAKAMFPQIDDLYEHIRQCIKNPTDLLTVLKDGSLEIAEVYKNKVRKVVIPTVQREQTIMQKLQRENTRLSNRIDQLAEEIRNQKQQVLGRIEQMSKKSGEKIIEAKSEILQCVEDEKKSNQKFREDLNEQLRRVKKQVLTEIELSKREVYNPTKLVLDEIQTEWQKKLTESEKKCSVAMEQTKSDCERVQREQQQRLDRVNEEIRKCNVAMEQIKSDCERVQTEQQQQLNRVNAEIRRPNETLASKESLQAMRQNFGKLSQKVEVNEYRQFALQNKQDQIQRKLQKYVTVLRTRFLLIEVQRVSFVVDTSLAAFRERWRIDEASKIIEKITNNSYRQVVGKNELPKTGNYYFEVRCINKCTPCFGIVTNFGRDKEWVEPEQDQHIIFYSYDGNIQLNGREVQKVKFTIKNGDLVSIFVDKQIACIRWFVNHHFIASARLAECFLTKPIYALLGQYYQGMKYQCIE